MFHTDNPKEDFNSDGSCDVDVMDDGDMNEDEESEENIPTGKQSNLTCAKLSSSDFSNFNDGGGRAWNIISSRKLWLCGSNTDR